MTDIDPLGFADRLCRAPGSADPGALVACDHPDLVTWTSGGGAGERATAADGSPVALPACSVGVVRDGQIVGLDGYLDPAAPAPWR